MSVSDPLILVEQMLRSARKIESYIEGLAKADFLGDSRTQEAVAMNLINIGEAASRLCNGHADFIARHPGVAWKDIRGMRNRIVHGYFSLDIDVVWETASIGAPELVRLLPGVEGMERG